MRWAVLLAALGLLIGASDAQAEPLIYPGQSPVSTPLMRSLEVVAEEYWSARGITLPQPVAVWRLPMVGYEGEGETPGNQVWIKPEYLKRLHAHERGMRIGYRTIICEIYLHERGHNAGLSHEAGFTIMHPEPPPNPPRRCSAWAYHPWR